MLKNQPFNTYLDSFFGDIKHNIQLPVLSLVSFQSQYDIEENETISTFNFKNCKCVLNWLGFGDERN